MIKESARLTPITSIGGGAIGALIGYLRARNGSKKEKLLNALKWGAGGLGLGYLGGYAADQLWLKPIVNERIKEKKKDVESARVEAALAKDRYELRNLNMYHDYKNRMLDPDAYRESVYYSEVDPHQPEEQRRRRRIDVPFYNIGPAALKHEFINNEYNENKFREDQAAIRELYDSIAEADKRDMDLRFELGEFERNHDMNKWYDLHTIPANIGNFLVDKLPGMIVGK